MSQENPMIERITRELRDRPTNSIKELVLDNCPRCHSIEGLNDEFTSLTVLSMINVGLQSLENFPQLKNLEKLYLSDNRLTNGLENLQNCPNLSLLILAGNKFKSLEQIQPLTKLTKLSVLDLANCPVTKEEKYREKIFEMFPQLKYLDNVDRDGVEKDSDDEDEDEEEEEEEEDDEEEEEENENEPGLNALYNGTLEDDDDEDSYKNQSGDDEEDEDLSDDADESADPVQTAKGEKRKHVEENSEDNPTKKI